MAAVARAPRTLQWARVALHRCVSIAERSPRAGPFGFISGFLVRTSLTRWLRHRRLTVSRLKRDGAARNAHRSAETAEGTPPREPFRPRELRAAQRAE